MQVDRLWTNGRLMTMADSGAGGDNAGSPGLGIVEAGAIAETAGRIVYAGPASGLASDLHATETVDLDGRWVSPGLIDCHTHIVHGGNRAKEFELRLAGASYEEIARAGGGIRSTVAATRAASEALSPTPL